jgi:hypothetical protein
MDILKTKLSINNLSITNEPSNGHRNSSQFSKKVILSNVSLQMDYLNQSVFSLKDKSNDVDPRTKMNDIILKGSIIEELYLEVLVNVILGDEIEIKGALSVEKLSVNISQNIILALLVHFGNSYSPQKSSKTSRLRELTPINRFRFIGKGL